MIIWLASYPRSGNTLLRTVCRYCFDLYSYADEPVDYESEFRSNPDLIGHQDTPGKWDDFYQQASRAPEIYLVKTHRPPMDHQPYVYIVRDGRSAIISYCKFNRYYNKLDIPLVNLILGAGGYGGWSEHYEQWNARDGINRMVFRFEDLVDISDDQLGQLGNFLGYDKKPAPWRNPLEDLKKVEPGFFGMQNEKFKGDDHWSPSHEFLFSKIHGDLMVRLGYYEPGGKADVCADFPDHVDHLMSEITSMVIALQEENRSLARTCQDRLDLIHQLNDACEQRLELIHSLHKQLAKQ